jgi:hypothetical protein
VSVDIFHSRVIHLLTLGGNRALAACIFPALFTSLILVDPVILEPADLGQLTKSDGLAFGALGRREQWPSQ